MVERDFQTLFNHYLHQNRPLEPECYELKICKTKRFPFSAVKDHQIDGLLRAESGMYHKITDMPWIQGRFAQAKKPFDCLWIQAKGYICVLFYVPRKPKTVAKVGIHDFINLRDTHPRKSITAEELFSFPGTELLQL